MGVGGRQGARSDWGGGGVRQGVLGCLRGMERLLLRTVADMQPDHAGGGDADHGDSDPDGGSGPDGDLDPDGGSDPDASRDSDDAGG